MNRSAAILFGAALLLAACGEAEDATAPLAQTGEPSERERAMLDDAASMLDEDTAQPPPVVTASPDNGPDSGE